MSEHTVIDHFNGVVQRERELLTESQDQLWGQADGLLQTTGVIQAIIDGRACVKPSQTHPRPTHAILRDVYFDITSPHRNGNESDALAFIGGMLIPMSGVEEKSIKPEAGILSVKRVDACSDAELRFNDCLTQVKTGQWAGQRYISVYHNAAGAALALRKSFGVSSALTLLPVSYVGSEFSNNSYATDKTEVPAGSIVAIGDGMDFTQSGRVSTDSGCTYITYLVEGPLSLRPARLSPWAYDRVLDRSIFALHKSNLAVASSEVKRGRVIESRTLEDFSMAAKQVMAMCGIE